MIEQKNTTHLLKKSLYEIKRLKREIEANENGSREPVAIIGMACRFPGGSNSPEKYWELLKNGKEGLCDVPSSRWNSEEYFDEEPGKPFKIYTNKLNFLAEDVSLFDPRLFMISPREAEEMDPQQRLLLELTWEALERAGYAPKALKGQAIAVFMGIITSEYGLLDRDMEKTGPYTMTGLLNSMAAGRIAHTFGLHGPALSIDTACSSSMVSIHQACKSIQDNECHTAIAGGAGLMLSTLPMINLCKLHALAKDGRCKSFSASGDGYGRGEGAGVVILKRLDLAKRDGDPVLAVIEASNLNHDGASSGLTVPNGKAQLKLLEETLSRENIQPRDIGYIEMHGTGTSLGDPIEFQSLVGVFGKDRDQNSPLMLGTCKANIGHLEAAAGIASVIKTILCLQNKAVPPHINCDEVNPRIQLKRIPAVLPGKYKNWETGDGKIRRVGISSFGFSGTNAFMIIKEAPESKTHTLERTQDRPKHILAISAQSKSALNELVGRYQDYVSAPSVTDLPSFANTINVGRSHFSWRAACVWSNKEELLSCLSDIVDEKDHSATTYYQGCSIDSEKRISIIFSGKLTGATSELASLIDSCSSFSNTWKECEQLFSSYANCKLTDLITKQHEYFSDFPIDKAAIVFSISYSMFSLFKYVGIKTSAVYAEGEGIFSMAAATGMLPLEQAISGLVQRYSSDQTSKLSPPEYKFSMPQFRVILPGHKDALKRSQLSDSSLFDCAFTESKVTENIQEVLGGDEALLIELDTRPDVLSKIYGGDVSDRASLCLTNFSWDGVINILAECYSLGHSINWSRFDEGFQREKLICPTYPFQRRSYWIDTSPGLLSKENNVTQMNVDSIIGNPLEGRVQSSPLKTSQVLFKFGPKKLPMLKDTHNIVHIGHFFEMLVSGIKQLELDSAGIRFLTFDLGLIIPEGEEKEIQLILDASLDDIINFTFHASGKHTGDWNQHVHGALGKVSLSHDELIKQDFTSIKSRCSFEMSGEKFYQDMEERGVVLGTSVQWVDQVWYRVGEAFAKFRIATSKECSLSTELSVHPGVWASCFQLLHATIDETKCQDVRFVLVGIGEIEFFQANISSTLWCHVISLGQPNEKGVLDGTFTLYSDSGEIVAHCHGCEMKEQAVNKEDENKRHDGNSEVISALIDTSSADHQLEVIVRYVKTILSELLKIPEDEISVSDSINQLGMDSLVGFELRDKINKEFGVPVPIATLLTGPTPKELAHAVQQDFIENHNVENADFKSDLVIPGYSEISLKKFKWVQGNSNERAEIRLYCLPYGGGGASLYRNWDAAFPDEINVLPIQLPGRQDRILERPIESVSELVKILTEVLGKDLNQPYAIYGHSAGALVAYTWARYLEESNLPRPEYLIVGGFTAPYISSPYLGVIKNIFCECGFNGIPSVDDFIQHAKQDPGKIKKCMARVAEITGIDLHQGFDSKEFSDAMMPQLVADSKLVESFEYHNAGRLSIPIAVLHGTDDDRVSLLGARAWKSLTTDSFTVETYPGDHFFLHADQCEKAVIKYIYDLLITHNQEVVLELN